MLTRRSFVRIMAGLSTGLVPALAANEREKKSVQGDHHSHEVTPAEDLMREHGALNRMLLIYEAALNDLLEGGEAHRTVILENAKLIRRFIEEYHAKLEEDHLFPCFRKAGKLVSSVEVLEAQHKAGNKLTDTIVSATESDRSLSAGRDELTKALSGFIRMFRPHEAREDTILFPAFRSIVSEREYRSLGEQFEETEHKPFGEGGFGGIVEQIAKLENRIGIYDLAQFTR